MEQGSRPPPPEKSQENVGFRNDAVPDPLKNHKDIKPAITGAPAKRHFNGVSLAGL